MDHFTEDTMKRRVLNALGRLCGRARTMSVDELARLAGESPATVRSYLEARNSAPFWRLWRLLAAADPRDRLAALDYLLAPLGYRAVALDAAALHAADSLAAITLVAAGLAEALRDGRLAHIERHALAEQARGLQPFLDSAPFWRLWRLLAAADPRDRLAALDYLLAPLGYRAVALDAAALHAADSLAAITLVAAGLAEALRDGRLDHIERHALAEQARGLQPFLDALGMTPSRSAEEA